jgi:hypothetical protein
VVTDGAAVERCVARGTLKRSLATTFGSATGAVWFVASCWQTVIEMMMLLLSNTNYFLSTLSAIGASSTHASIIAHIIDSAYILKQQLLIIETIETIVFGAYAIFAWRACRSKRSLTFAIVATINSMFTTTTLQ